MTVCICDVSFPCHSSFTSKEKCAEWDYKQTRAEYEATTNKNTLKKKKKNVSFRGSCTLNFISLKSELVGSVEKISLFYYRYDKSFLTSYWLGFCRREGDPRNGRVGKSSLLLSTNVGRLQTLFLQKNVATSWNGIREILLGVYRVAGRSKALQSPLNICEHTDRRMVTCDWVGGTHLRPINQQELPLVWVKADWTCVRLVDGLKKFAGKLSYRTRPLWHWYCDNVLAWITNLHCTNLP